MTAAEFCHRSALSSAYNPVIDSFRAAFAGLVSVTSDRIYPDDRLHAFGIDYADDLGMFLTRAGLLTNKDYQYDFPMEEVSGLADVIALTLQLNNEYALHTGPNQGPKGDDPWGLDHAVTPTSFGGVMRQIFGRWFRKQTRTAEQPSTAQPGTQPADKPSKKNQPPTPTSENGPR